MNTFIQKKETMQRVHMVFWTKKLYGRIAVKTYILAALIYMTGSAVHVRAVFENMPALSDIGGVLKFYSYAFLNTQATVQLIALGIIAASGLLLKDFFQKEIV